MQDLDFDIRQSQKSYATAHDIEIPDGIQLLSYDKGIAHAKLTGNGMSVAIVPHGRGESVMLRCLCVGGSRLETSQWAGSCHVLEHLDFRLFDWQKHGGVDLNAATSKTFIEQQAFGLLHPKHQHVKNILQLMSDTLVGNNLKKLTESHIGHEKDDVLDERDFNAQIGSSYRVMIMKGEEKLLQRVWQQGSWTQPTIGNDESLSNIKTTDDVLRLQSMFRSPDRTTLVMSGPIDINKSLALFRNRFKDLPPNKSPLLRSIPASRLPAEKGRIVSNVTTDSGISGIAISGLKGAYGPESDVMMVMQHLVGMLGAQPQVAQHGLTEVTMYTNPEQEAGVFAILGRVNVTDNEEQSFLQAQHAIERFVMEPLLHFSNDGLLSQLLTQLRGALQEATVSGPQETAALAVQGLLACNKPSLAWHIDDRFSESNINSVEVRNVAAQMFHSDQLAVTRCTAKKDSAGLAPTHSLAHGFNPLQKIVSHFEEFIGLVPPQSKAAPIRLTSTTAHMQSDSNQANPDFSNEYFDDWNSNPTLKLQSITGQQSVLASYNAKPVLPLSKHLLTCRFGSVSDFGGWARSTLAVEGMNVISKSCAAGLCDFKIENGNVIGEIFKSNEKPSPPGMPFMQPLISTVAIATLIGSTDGASSVPTVAQLKGQIPEAALQASLASAQKMYQSPTSVAQAQTRNQMCSESSPGYQPASLDEAARDLQANKSSVTAVLAQLVQAPLTLAGTNMNEESLSYSVQAFGGIQQEAKQIQDNFKLVAHTVDLKKQQPPNMTMLQSMPGLRTYPYVASAKADRALQREDRAALIVSGQIMAGGMGSVYTHDLRQRGLSYRPSGQACTSWQKQPVLMLHATFDEMQAHEGSTLTKQRLQQWCRGSPAAFTPEHVALAKLHLNQKLLLTRNEFDAVKFTLLSDMNPEKLHTDDIKAEINKVTAESLQSTLQSYFEGASVKQSWVAQSESVALS